MIRNFKKQLVALLLLVSPGAAAQTGGSSDLSSIESKARLITQNDEKVGELNRNHLQSYTLEQEKLNKLKREVAELIAEKARVLDEYRRGQFCTGCNTPRSQFKPGESFPHSGQSVRAATPEELARKAQEYDNKISAKETELKKFESEENEFTRKRADLSKQMDNLKANSDKLRAEIVALSKSYKDKVVATGKSTQRVWVSDLMRLVANKHIIEDKLDILSVKLGDVSKDEALAIAASNKKVSEQNEREIQDLKNLVAQQSTRLNTAVNAFQQNAAALNQQIARLRSSLEEIDKQLAKTGQSAADTDQLKANRDSVAADLEQARKRLSDLENNHKSLENNIKEDIKSKNDKIWDLTINLTKRQEAAVAAIKQGFAVKAKALNDAIVARREHLKSAGDLLMSKRAEYRKKFLEFANLVDQERVRLLRACSTAGASCFGIDTHGTVVGNWNTASGCVGQMESNRAIGTYYGCTEEAAIYKTHYSSHINGLSDDDLNALKRTSSKAKYDLILKKVID